MAWSPNAASSFCCRRLPLPLVLLLVLAGFQWGLVCGPGAVGVTAFTFSLDRKECFYQHVPTDEDAVYASFVVVRSEYYWSEEQGSVDLVVEAPDGSQVQTVRQKSEASLSFIAGKAGDYKFCFINRSPIHESISFDFHETHEKTKKDLAKDEHVDPLMHEIFRIKNDVAHAHHEILYSFHIAYQHYELDRRMGRRVLMKALLEALAIVAVSVAQVYLLRRLFEKRMSQSRV